ncbi:MAG: hypothetical protein GY757_57030, partial [bacterium]|nr:hypothetical protein [bacterium]
MMEKKIVPQVIPGKNTADGKLTEMILAYLITVDIEKLRHITVGSLAEMFGKTQSYISSIFKRDHSISLCQLLNMEKMLRVSKLLKGKTVMSLSKLCSHLRYSRADYFVKVFKKHFY